MIKRFNEDEEDYQRWLDKNDIDGNTLHEIKQVYTKRYDELFNNSENLSNNKDKWILFKVDSNSFKDLFDDLEQINFISDDFEYTNFKLEKDDPNNPVYSADKTATSDIIGRDGKTVMQQNGTVRRAKNLSLSTLRSQLKSKLIKWKKEPELYDYYIKITRDIKEITHMSTDKYWDSCQSIDRHDEGGYNHYVFDSIKEGLLIAYAYKVKLDDLDSIDNNSNQFADEAIARISINPFSTANNQFLYLRAIKTYAPTWFHNQQPFNMKSEVQKYLDKHYNHDLLELDDVFYASDSFYSDDRVSQFNPKTQEYKHNQDNNPNDEEYNIPEEEYNCAYDFIMDRGEMPDTDFLTTDNITLDEWIEIVREHSDLIDEIPYNYLTSFDDIEKLLSYSDDYATYINYDYLNQDELIELLNKYDSIFYYIQNHVDMDFINKLIEEKSDVLNLLELEQFIVDDHSDYIIDIYEESDDRETILETLKQKMDRDYYDRVYTILLMNFDDLEIDKNSIDYKDIVKSIHSGGDKMKYQLNLLNTYNLWDNIPIEQRKYIIERFSRYGILKYIFPQVLDNIIVQCEDEKDSKGLHKTSSHVADMIKALIVDIDEKQYSEIENKIKNLIEVSGLDIYSYIELFKLKAFDIKFLQDNLDISNINEYEINALLGADETAIALLTFEQWSSLNDNIKENLSKKHPDMLTKYAKFKFGDITKLISHLVDVNDENNNDKIINFLNSDHTSIEKVEELRPTIIMDIINRGNDDLASKLINYGFGTALSHVYYSVLHNCPKTLTLLLDKYNIDDMSKYLLENVDNSSFKPFIDKHIPIKSPTALAMVFDNNEKLFAYLVSNGYEPPINQKTDNYVISKLINLCNKIEINDNKFINWIKIFEPFNNIDINLIYGYRELLHTLIRKNNYKLLKVILDNTNKNNLYKSDNNDFMPLLKDKPEIEKLLLDNDII